jgi:hypothetical protein
MKLVEQGWQAKAVNASGNGTPMSAKSAAAKNVPCEMASSRASLNISSSRNASMAIPPLPPH